METVSDIFDVTIKLINNYLQGSKVLKKEDLVNYKEYCRWKSYFKKELEKNSMNNELLEFILNSLSKIEDILIEQSDTVKYTILFEIFLDVIDFELVKYQDGYGLNDIQYANLGNIESDRFKNAKEIFDRLDIYIQDYYINVLEDATEEKDDKDNVCSCETWLEYLDKHKDLKTEYILEYKVFDMIVNHADNIDLECVIIDNI